MTTNVPFRLMCDARSGINGVCSLIVAAAVGLGFAISSAADDESTEPPAQPAGEVAAAEAASDSGGQDVALQTFRAVAGGQQVTPNLPIYKVHVNSDGLLVDESGNPFNSYRPQTTTPTSKSKCVIRNLGWAAYLTTFYIVPQSDPGHLYLVKSCGKSPLQLNSTTQYSNISQDNFINHAQIAGTAPDGRANPVYAAGEIDIIDGRIVYMDTCSGHFKPNIGSLLAYMDAYLTAPLPLTTPIKNIIALGWITDQEIDSNLTRMIESSSIVPRRNYRSGTGNCISYTTVFLPSVSGDRTTLTGGLLAYKKGGIQIFQSDINTITNKNIKDIKLTPNCCFYDYAAYVITDWHMWNNATKWWFTDETDDTYSLSIHVYSYNHEVDYNSTKPNIKKIVFDINF